MTISKTKKSEKEARKLWGGYYVGNLGNLCREQLSSLRFDKDFYDVSIEVFKAHLKMCKKRKIIKSDDVDKLKTSLDKVKKEICSGRINLEDTEAESVHFAIKELVRKDVGDVVNELDIAHSVQEHETTVMRLWIRESLNRIDTAIKDLMLALLEQAEANIKIIMPSYLYKQISQPVSLANYLMSYVEALSRDRERLVAVWDRVNRSPMGAYISSGTSFEVSRSILARALDFKHILENSMDAIYNRDFVIDFMAFLSMNSVHLTRIAQDMLDWQDANADFIEFTPDLLAKDPISKNARYPQIIEYVRGKIGGVVGDLNNVLMSIKGISSGFSRDLTEIAEPVIRSAHSVEKSLKIMSILTANFRANRKKTKESAYSPDAFAEDILQWLLRNTSLDYFGAVDVTSKIINYSKSTKTKLSLISIETLKKISPDIDKNIYSVLISSRAVVNRRSAGSNPTGVKKSIRKHLRDLSKKMK